MLPYQEIDQASAHELAKHFADAVLPDESLSFAEHFNGDRHVDLFDSFSWRTLMILLENHYMTNFWINKPSLRKSRALMYMGKSPYPPYPRHSSDCYLTLAYTFPFQSLHRYLS